MTGFSNVEQGFVHFLQRLGGGLTAIEQAVLAAIHPSFVALVKVAETHGTEFVQALTAAMFSAALSAVTGGTGTLAEIASAAGKAAIAAGEAVAAAQGKAIASDALHAIATAQVSAAQAATGQSAS